jgi:hypothetical protein
MFSFALIYPFKIPLVGTWVDSGTFRDPKGRYWYTYPGAVKAFPLLWQSLIERAGRGPTRYMDKAIVTRQDVRHPSGHEWILYSGEELEALQNRVRELAPNRSSYRSRPSWLYGNRGGKTVVPRHGREPIQEQPYRDENGVEYLCNAQAAARFNKSLGWAPAWAKRPSKVRLGEMAVRTKKIPNVAVSTGHSFVPGYRLEDLEAVAAGKERVPPWGNATEWRNQEAVDWLRRLLVDGPVLCTDGYHRAKGDRIWDPYLAFARQELNIESKRADPKSRLYWCLPGQKPPSDGQRKPHLFHAANRVLKLIMKRGPMTIEQVMEALRKVKGGSTAGTKKSNITHLLIRLEKAGKIKRKRAGPNFPSLWYMPESEGLLPHLPERKRPKLQAILNVVRKYGPIDAAGVARRLGPPATRRGVYNLLVHLTKRGEVYREQDGRFVVPEAGERDGRGGVGKAPTAPSAAASRPAGIEPRADIAPLDAEREPERKDYYGTVGVSAILGGAKETLKETLIDGFVEAHKRVQSIDTARTEEVPPSRPPKRSRGRPSKDEELTPVQEEQIRDAWGTRRFPDKEALDRELGYPTGTTRRVIDKLRKRPHNGE